MLSWIAAARDTLRAVAAGRSPLEGFDVWERPDGQAVVRVYPHGLKERLLLHGYTVDVRMQPGVGAAEVPDTVATFYKRADPPGRVALVLGAGNIASIPPLDLLYKLFGEGEVVVVKLNPINDYLAPGLRARLRAARRRRLLRFVSGGGEVGGRLCAHPGVETLHITGSARTHDRIVYGEGEEGAARRARDERVLSKPISSELGGVGPTIVVPGPWRQADFDYQAEHLATQKLHNSGHNCVASQVLVLPAGWAGSDRLLDAVRRRMREAVDRPAYYTGSTERIGAVAGALSARPRRSGRARTRGSWSATSTPPSRPPTRSPRSSSPRCWRRPRCRAPIPRTSCGGRWRSATRRCTGRSGRTC